MQFPFEGKPRPLPPGIPQGAAQYVVNAYPDGSPEPVRHAEGYKEFAARFWTETGTTGRALRPDGSDASAHDPIDPVARVDRAARIIAENGPALLSDPVLLRSAAMFFGNALVAAMPDGQWRVFGGEPPEVWTATAGLCVELLTIRLAEGRAEGLQIIKSSFCLD